MAFSGPEEDRTSRDDDEDEDRNLIEMLPTEAEIPGGLILTETGIRTSDDITQTFPDPIEAAERFIEWGWEENVFRTFATLDNTVTVEVSAHRFGSEEAAAAALLYLAEARVAQLGLHEFSVESIGDQMRAIGGPVGESTEVTLYIRRDAIVTRVTAVSSQGNPTETALTTAEVFLTK